MLYVEQVLTTGGGWQDQVGGFTPALKIGRFHKNTLSERSRITVEYPGSHTFAEKMNGRLALVYTGRTRLAKNLLQVNASFF